MNDRFDNFPHKSTPTFSLSHNLPFLLQIQFHFLLHVSKVVAVRLPEPRSRLRCALSQLVRPPLHRVVRSFHKLRFYFIFQSGPSTVVSESD